MHTPRSTITLAIICLLLITALLGLLARRHYMYVKDLEKRLEEWEERAATFQDELYEIKQQRENQELVMLYKQEREAYEQAEAAKDKASLDIVAKHTIVANKFKFNGIPTDFVEYCDDDLKFCFSYPSSWGKVDALTSYPTCENGEKIPEYIRSFSNRKSKGFGVSAPIIARATGKECPIGRESSIGDELASKNIATADRIITTASNEQIGVWYGLGIGWETHRYIMGFSAPTGYARTVRVSFVGPTSSDPELTEKDIYDFLTVASSYRVVTQ